MKVVLFCILGLLISTASAANTWKIVDHGYAAISLSLSFQGQQSGWVAGATSDAEALLLHTVDGGTTLTPAPVDVENGVLMSISFHGAQYGVAGALGFVGLPCGFITVDGKNWTKIHDGIDILCAVQDTSTPADNVFVLIGEFSHPTTLGGDGIQVSTNGGASWRVESWKQGIDARYGKFLSGDVGYVTGGDWPSNNNSLGKFPRQISRHVQHDGKKFSVQKDLSTLVDGYRGVIARTDDSGKTWETLVNWTSNGVYFNEISCTDVNTCWVVGEGVNKTTGTTAAYIYATTDGFKTIEQQHYFEFGSLIAINMLSPTYGWAGGADLREHGLDIFTANFFLTQDGKTWTQYQTIGNFYPMDISTVDNEYAYAAGLNELSLADLVQFGPH